jgi:glycosyltransferase involved in cell wall biosynthesis
MRIGIDATSIVDGGGLTHLKELIKNYLNKKTNHQLIIYASKNVLDQLSNHPKLSKHNFSFLNKSILHRLFFQILLFDKYLKSECDVFLSVTGDYVGSFRPYIAMSQNMMLYEREFWKEIKSLKEKAKFFFNYNRQKKCFKNAEGIIFLSQYAKDYILSSLKIENKNTSIIHHGISPKFLSKKFSLNSIKEYSIDNPFRFLYVSTVHVYKNQWNVVAAISKLRQKGYPVTLTLIGNVIYEPSGERLTKLINQLDPDNQFINHILNIPHDEIADKYFTHDGIIFASTCENMPNILLESMASGKPIACSNKQPMPEFLKDGGYYFNAKSVNSIFETLENLLNSLKKFEKLNKLNVQELKKYNWEETSTKTIDFIEKSYLNYKNASE